MYSGEINAMEYSISKKHFAIMGILDGLTSVSSQFAINYIYKSSLIPLLQQASLPLSMIASKLVVTDREVFHRWNYIGSFVVFLGLMVVLIPGIIFDRGTPEHTEATIPIFWCIVLVLSCIPTVFSSAYKEEFMNNNHNVNIMYVNYWISIFQFIFVFPTIFLSGLLGSGSIEGGVKCLFGIDTIIQADNSTNFIDVDIDNCKSSLWFVNLYIVFNFIYNIYLILVLKRENNSLLWLALTLVVPLSQIVLWIPGVPRHSRFSIFDLIGLFVILVGMLIYYFKKPADYFMLEPHGRSSLLENFL